MKKFNIEVNENQARIISRALDTWSRLFSGQFSNIIHDLNKGGEVDWLEFEHNIKKIVFPNLQPNESYAIHSREISDAARVAYDIHQVLRNAIAVNREVSEPYSYSTHLHDPLKTSTEEDLCKVTVEDKVKEEI